MEIFVHRPQLARQQGHLYVARTSHALTRFSEVLKRMNAR
jgi:hypothetical protein